MDGNTRIMFPSSTATKETVVAWYYDDPSNTWTYKELQVRLAEEWFSKGGMRLAYQMVICDPDGTERQFVAKLYNEFAEVFPQMCQNSTTKGSWIGFVG